ncbi:DUF3718 domain-containing protein [Alteromonas aestuariivivens]|uniref:DUF3718 domain-containing protein n=1 Tax=Alteromonas aestuariivivens TaxID=1938339 RepID=A0A3D8M473_9ALTE|nr:DUF3718 domain-containing protein [Alteromonas aestuariivivens]RDV24334.1 DUF3718 domain-containing protein [Alteromonas aestuariivivens]
MTNNLLRRTFGFCAASIAGAFLLTGAANATSYPAHLENDLIKICQAIKDNDVLDLKRAVKQSRLKYEALEKGLVCNGQDMMAFAVTHGSDRAGHFLAARLHKDSTTLTAKR